MSRLVAGWRHLRKTSVIGLLENTLNGTRRGDRGIVSPLPIPDFLVPVFCAERVRYSIRPKSIACGQNTTTHSAAVSCSLWRVRGWNRCRLDFGITKNAN